MNTASLTEYKVWDLPTRLFHWINVTAIIGLLFLGFIMLYKKELGISAIETKIALKEVHVVIGYIFGCNLLFRILWGFIGNTYSRWSSIIPGKNFPSTLRLYITSIKQGNTQQFLGHNPLGRLAIVFILLLMLTLLVSGLIRAGTDIYYPPFGSTIAEYIAAPGVNPENIKPHDNEGTIKTKTDNIFQIKVIFGRTHRYTAFILMFMIALHIFIVIRTEVREGGGLISAMFTGKKVLKKPPADL
ncbi:cytochrome B [Gammaproteobacteria bacterium 42_54_T18]|nr:cytochrome B [Gammaproteobacteria bacterium 42_54_T18]